MALQAGELLNGRYRIQKRLGRGGFGAVYLANDEKSGRLRVIKENLDTSAEAKEQFHLEAQLLARTPEVTNGEPQADPGLPHVWDYLDLGNKGQFLIMEYIEGEDLLSLVEKQGPVDPELALTWIKEVGGSLNYLHGMKPPLIHRDVKPANIRLSTTEDKLQARLVDFGLAKSFSSGEKTVLGARAISPGYSPPEQYTMGGTDARSDVYSLGATLYFLLTGKEPMESVQRLIRDTLRSPHERNGRVSPGLSKAVMTAMALDAEKRYGTIEEFLAALPAGEPTPDQMPTTLLPPTPDINAHTTITELPAGQVATRTAQAAAGAETTEKKNENGRKTKEKASLPVKWFRQNITALTYAAIALCITGFTLALTVLYVNNLPANALSGVTETPTTTALIIISTATPTFTPSPTETATPTFTPTNSPQPTHTVMPTIRSTATPFPTQIIPPTPTNTPVPPEIQEATIQAMNNFADANALSTPPGNYILAENEVVELEHDVAIGPAFHKVDVAQEDFVIRAVFANPYDADEDQWDYGFFLRIQPDDDERFSVSVTSDKNWEIRYHENAVDANGTIVGEGEIENLNIGGGGINILMVIMAGENGYLIVNEGEIFPLNLSRIVAPGVIQVVTGIRPGYKSDGAVTQFWDLSIYDLTTE